MSFLEVGDGTTIHFGREFASTPVTEAVSVASANAHHRPGGGYRNPWPEGELHGLKDFLAWRIGEWRRGSRVPSPPVGSLPSRHPAIVAPHAARGYRSATWVGHSTVLLQLGSLNVLTDPVWSDRASPLRWVGPRRLMPPALDFDALPKIDVVLVSHNHYDHLDAPTVKRLAKRFPDATWLCPLGVAALLRSWGVRAIEERDWWQHVDAPNFRAACTPAQHFSARGLGDRNDTLWCGWTIEADGVRVYFAGDTALHPEFGAIGERLGPFDLVMLPIGAYDPRWFMRAVHMDPEDAVAAYRALLVNTNSTPPCLALHWGTFRRTDEPVDEPPTRFTRAWRDAGLPESTCWVFAHGETRRI
jgi:N-acyl-phosphatidylethanolamine-hydrolysing phospholipase D